MTMIMNHLFGDGGREEASNSILPSAFILMILNIGAMEPLVLHP